LHISVRIFGEEPLCRVTRNYHAQIKELLPLCGLEYKEIPRIRYQDAPISASRVRALLEKGEMEMLKQLVPLTTFLHLKSVCNKE
jgi:[citrate (pro-3S)-lyase] ligase